MLLLVANEKGGVGKTTIAINIAVMCAMAGKNTILVDTDKQESASDWSDVRNERNVGARLTCVSKRGKLGHDLVSLKSNYDIVIVDAGGRDSIEMRQAMAVCDTAIIPIKPAQLDVWSLSKMAQLIADVMERTDSPVNAFALINGASPNPAVRETQEAKEAVQDYVNVFPMLESVITERISFRKASRDGLGVVELAPSQTDPKANLEMMALYQEIFNEIWTVKNNSEAA